MKSTVSKFFSWTPSTKTISFLDIFGFNILLSFFWNLIFKIIFFLKKKNRKLLSEKEIFNLNRDGFCVIENFMSIEDYKDLKQKLSHFIIEKNEFNDSNDISIPLKTFNKNFMQDKILDNYFGKNSDLHCLIEYISNISSNIETPLEYRKIIINNEKGIDRYSDSQEKLHKDVFYDTYKAIFYLNDTNEDNGAFIYLRGSSIFKVLNIFKNYLNGIMGINSYEKIYNNKQDEISVKAKENSLIIMNASGLHKRGVFNRKGFRETIFADFRHFHSIYNLKSIIK